LVIDERCFLSDGNSLLGSVWTRFPDLHSIRVTLHSL
jgi:hypothetical protein